MNICIVLLFLAMPTCTFNMLSDEEMQKFVESYTSVHTFKVSAHSLLYEPKSDQLIVGLNKNQGLTAFDCKTYKSTPIHDTSKITHLTLSADQNIFYGIKERSPCPIVVGNLENHTCQPLDPLLCGDTLAYSLANKELYVGLFQSITVLNQTNQKNSWHAAFNGYISNFCCNDTNKVFYVSSTEGSIQRWSMSGTCEKTIKIESHVKSMLCDQKSGDLYIIRALFPLFVRYDAKLENSCPVEYHFLPDSPLYPIEFAQDTISQLMCLTSTSLRDQKRVHFFDPNNPKIQYTTQLNESGLSIACDPTSSTFFIGTTDGVHIFKPKTSYIVLSLLKQSIFTVFKIYKQTLRGLISV